MRQTGGLLEYLLAKRILNYVEQKPHQQINKQKQRRSWLDYVFVGLKIRKRKIKGKSGRGKLYTKNMKFFLAW